jgi:UDP-N-acetylmuramoylalanine--D-glutamate ligase
MRLSELRGRRVTIWGFRLEGRSMFDLLRGWGDTELRVVDDDPAVAASGTGSEVVVEPGPAGGALQWAEVVVKSPGITVHQPLVHELRRTVPVVGLMALWLAERGGANAVGVTGTKGKSTTAAFLAHLLAELGQPARLAGNIGASVADLSLPAPSGTVDVVEVSSYQAEDVTVGPELGVFTSFFPEHLDWHGSFSQYRHDKTNLFRHGTRDVITSSAELVAVLRAGGVTAPAAVVPAWPAAARRYGGAPANAVALAVAVAGALGIEPDHERVAAAAASFTTLACRQQVIVADDAITVVDDALATIPQATIDCLVRGDGAPVTLLFGGKDRHVDQRPLVDAVAPRLGTLRVLGLPDTGWTVVDELLAGGADPASCQRIETVEEGVGLALGHARVGEILLLSPGAASYNRHANYQELSARFRDAVQRVRGS